MKRRLLNILTALSLLLWLATVVLGVRSYWFDGAFIYRSQPHPIGRIFTVETTSVRIRIEYWRVERDVSKLPAPSWLDRMFPERASDFGWKLSSSHVTDDLFWMPSRDGWLDRLGFDAFHDSPPYGADYFSKTDRWRLVIPMWIPFALCAMLPTVWLLAVLRRRYRFSRGHCPTCGYDLRATPERCPECGDVPGVKS